MKGEILLYCYSWAILGFKARASGIEGKYSTTELQLQAFNEGDSYQIHYKRISFKAI